MTLRPFSDHQRGLFISVDGPSGAGKSTVVQHLAQMLVGAGETVHVTAEPSTGPIGALARDLTETVTGHALACLYAADRYHHIDTEIRSHVDNGTTVISDRYIPSALVMQRFDGVDAQRLTQAGFDVLHVDCNQRAAHHVAAHILDRLTTSPEPGPGREPPTSRARRRPNRAERLEHR
jgi:ribose 1,5-bisphosphokinase PhnN